MQHRIPQEYCPSPLRGSQQAGTTLVPGSVRGRKLSGEGWDIYFPGHLYSPSFEASSASGFPWLHPREGFLLTESIPQPGLRQELQEICPVGYSKPRGWKLSKGEITVVVLYIAPVLSGDLRAWAKQGFNHPPTIGRLA